MPAFLLPWLPSQPMHHPLQTPRHEVHEKPPMAPGRPGQWWGRLWGALPPCKPSSGCGCRRGTPCPSIRGVRSSDVKREESLSFALTELSLVIPYTEKHVKLGNTVLTLIPVMLFYLFHCSVAPVSQIEFRTPFY